MTKNQLSAGLRRRMNALKFRCDVWTRSLPHAAPLAQLAEVIRAAFENYFTGNPRFVLTSQQLDYFNRVVDELEIVLRQRKTSDSETLLENMNLAVLILNFNVRSYCLHYFDQVQLKLKTLGSIDEKLETLHYHLKVIGQVRCERGMKYYDLYPGVKDFIGGWLTEEIAFMERKASRFSTAPEESVSSYFENGGTMKIRLDTSVAKLACMTRALVERGIIANSNISDLSQVMSRFTVTRRSENVSARSFRLRYYDIEDSTRSSVARTLKDLARHVETMGSS